MQANYLSGVANSTLLDPDASAWQSGTATTIKLVGTPASLQPTAAIRANWEDRPIGAITEVSIVALHNSEVLAFRLQWDEPNPSADNGDNTRFPDGAAVAFPLVGEPSLVTMGAQDQPISIWSWRAGEQGGKQLVAAGLGTSEIIESSQISTNQVWHDGQYSVVIARTMFGDSNISSAQFRPGQHSRFGLAIWSGRNGERAGIKSFTPAWYDLHLATG
ncbi:MAG: hypothetical protein HOC23_00465 [Halieaceae bacterium]|jgi:steroid C-25 hydroxylase gamma subunit|nr:hypothetical protein [Halieaceae bacterium]